MKTKKHRKHAFPRLCDKRTLMSYTRANREGNEIDAQLGDIDDALSQLDREELAEQQLDALLNAIEQNS